jgi:hypothetical protein
MAFACRAAISIDPIPQAKHTPPVGASLLAKAIYQSKMILLTYRFREQARSHKGSLIVPTQSVGTIKSGTANSLASKKPVANDGTLS